MQRVAFLIRVRPEKLDEYKRLHDPLNAELAAVLRKAGIRNYSLWMRPDGTEFGYLECDNWEQTCAELARSPVHDRWQVRMQEFLLSPVSAEQGGQPIELLERVMLVE
jgi:L-rhamnose mutarotase